MIFGFRTRKKTERGRRIWDRVKLHVPMKIGDTSASRDGALLAHALDAVAAGVDIIKALEITGRRPATT